MAVFTTALLALSACSSGSESDSSPGGDMAVVRVPADVGTLQEAADTVAEDGLILIAPGTYTETMTLTTPGVTVRGEDRNGVIIDGEGIRSNGIVAPAPDVTVENLTVIDQLLNGVLITGMVDENGEGIGRGSDGYKTLDPEEFPPIPGFTVRNVTAAGNGLYGIYAFNRLDGTIRDSYASGSADSGIYVGQCQECNILVDGNVAERNAIGLEMANASGVTVVRNRFTHNRVGASIQSNYQEAYVPLTGATVLGNVVSDNVEPASPAVAEGGFGIGIGLLGTQDSVVRANRVEGNSTVGLAIAPTRDLTPFGNEAAGNAVTGNGVDAAVWTTSQSPAGPNCLRLPRRSTTSPDPLPASQRCQSQDDLADVQAPTQKRAPRGMAFLDVPKPGDLPSLSFTDPATEYGPSTAPTMPEADSIALPAADWLQEQTFAG